MKKTVIPKSQTEIFELDFKKFLETFNIPEGTSTQADLENLFDLIQEKNLSYCE